MNNIKTKIGKISYEQKGGINDNVPKVTKKGTESQRSKKTQGTEAASFLRSSINEPPSWEWWELQAWFWASTKDANLWSNITH